MTTIKFCKKCNADTECYGDSNCKICAKARAKAYREANPEKAREAVRLWGEKNPEKKNESTKAWVEANPERKKANNKAYYNNNIDKHIEYANEWKKANPEKVRLSKKKWADKNPEKDKACRKAWKIANPEKSKIYFNNRRARKLAAGGNLSIDIESKLFNLQRGKCACCKLPLGDDYHLDHIMPLALGGSNTDDNIQLLRAICNLQKHTSHPVDFMQSRGFLL